MLCITIITSGVSNKVLPEGQVLITIITSKVSNKVLPEGQVLILCAYS